MLIFLTLVLWHVRVTCNYHLYHWNFFLKSSEINYCLQLFWNEPSLSMPIVHRIFRSNDSDSLFFDKAFTLKLSISTIFFWWRIKFLRSLLYSSIVLSMSWKKCPLEIIASDVQGLLFLLKTRKIFASSANTSTSSFSVRPMATIFYITLSWA